MTGLSHSPLFDVIRRYFEQRDTGQDRTFLFVPYIQMDVLKMLLDGIQNRVIVVTTWKPRDIQSGSSDLSVYPFCRANRISLYVNNRLHLKAYSVNLDSMILATGNVSRHGLLPDGNHEMAVRVDAVDPQNRLFLEGIQREARLVDDVMYDSLRMWIESNPSKPLDPVDLDSIIPPSRDDDFLTSSLPMTSSVDDLVTGYRRISRGKESSDDAETAACITHDLANYGIRPGLSEDEFRAELATRFFAHPFIRKIDKFIAPEAYFGRIKEWIQNNCTDVPVPSRRELTGNVQVLLSWFAELGGGRYVVDVPGARSQRIRKTSM